MLLTLLTDIARHTLNIRRTSTVRRSNKPLFTSSKNNFGPLFISFLLGMLVTGIIIYLFSANEIILKLPTGKKQPNKINAPTNNPAKPINNQPPAVKEPRFDFYNELTNNQANERELHVESNKVASTEPGLKANKKPIHVYVVQVGIYEQQAEAEEVRARLTLNGFGAKVQNVAQTDGIVYRVILGPCKTEENAKALQGMLKTLAIDSRVVVQDKA